jgi:hypothetical protein
LEEGKEEYTKIYILIKKDLLKRAYTLLINRYKSPARKLHVIMNEALEEYLEKHKDEIK